jgi:hypothetical protein
MACIHTASTCSCALKFVMKKCNTRRHILFWISRPCVGCSTAPETVALHIHRRKARKHVRRHFYDCVESLTPPIVILKGFWDTPTIPNGGAKGCLYYSEFCAVLVSFFCYRITITTGGYRRHSSATPCKHEFGFSMQRSIRPVTSRHGLRTFFFQT